MKFGILLLLVVLALISVASAALPANPVSATLTYKGGPEWYWTINVNTASIPEVPALMYEGWCADKYHYIGSTSTPKTYNSFTAYDSRDPNSWANTAMPPANWKAINWIMNNKHNDWRINQAALWHFDGEPNGFPESWDVKGYDKGAFTTYINSVDINFIPACGETYAVILYDPLRNDQVIFVERPTPACTNTPEFPTLALPVAMMLGVVYTVHVIKGREK